MRDRAVSALRSFKDSIVSKADEAIAWVRGLPDRIASAVGNLGSLLVSKGKDVVRGLWSGIKSMGAWLRSTLSSWAKDLIPGPIAEALGIASPSKVMARDVGRWIPAGVVKGIEAGSRRGRSSHGNAGHTARRSGPYARPRGRGRVRLPVRGRRGRRVDGPR